MLPTRLGRPFRWLLGASWVGNIGDGIALAAGPLLVASQTRSPILVAMAALLQRLPWLLFGLYAGAVADRLERRRIVAVANALRAIVVALLCLAISTGRVSIALVLVVLFLYGTAETFADTASSAFLPMLVDRRDLGVGNARLQAGFLTANQLVGPPLGAFLFAAGMVWPFVTQVVCVAAAVVLVLRVRVPTRTTTEPVGDGTPTRVRQDIAEGFRWLMGHPPVRTLALVILAFNITWGAAWSVLVLYAQDVVGLGAVGFGLLTTAAAVGGLVTTTAYDWLERRFSLAGIMRTCLTLEVLTHLALAVTRIGWVAIAIMVVFGGYAFVWGTVSVAVRQRAVPLAFQGRVGSVYVVGLFLGLVVGQALGGPLAQWLGVTAPYWFAFGGSALTLVLVWRRLADIAHEAEA